LLCGMKGLACLVTLLGACGGSSAGSSGQPAEPAPAPAAAHRAPACHEMGASAFAVTTDRPETTEPQRTWLASTRAVLTTSCTEDDWSSPARTCFAGAADPGSIDACRDMLEANARARLDERLASQIDERFENAQAELGNASPRETNRLPAFDPARLALYRTKKTGSPECDRFLATFVDYVLCDRVPQDAKEGSIQTLETLYGLYEPLRDPSVPDERKKVVVDACMEARAALLQSAQELGCKL
jgi:hypothetical protein